MRPSIVCLSWRTRSTRVGSAKTTNPKPGAVPRSYRA
ncbi:unnamed protein product [Spirodela intermedia]|uniref:Uncharacterized protein n=1 Tax=Spirodela intermedia TaxID=51605 RepID=A0A7I8IC62_SPIIN|nr:unnamed protein product [Spirodela intermedia]CAA6655330.1 unnamed protein product [Spirodela intermedia]